MPNGISDNEYRDMAADDMRQDHNRLARHTVDLEQRVSELETAVEYLRGKVTEIENRQDRDMGAVSGHRHWIERDSAETDAWYR